MQKDEVTNYLEMVLKGLVERKPDVSVNKEREEEFADGGRVLYTFNVADDDKKFFNSNEGKTVYKGLKAITGRAAGIFYPKYNNWEAVLEMKENPI